MSYYMSVFVLVNIVNLPSTDPLGTVHSLFSVIFKNSFLSWLICVSVSPVSFFRLSVIFRWLKGSLIDMTFLLQDPQRDCSWMCCYSNVCSLLDAISAFYWRHSCCAQQTVPILSRFIWSMYQFPVRLLFIFSYLPVVNCSYEGLVENCLLSEVCLLPSSRLHEI